MRLSIALLASLLFSGASHAQFGNLLKDLKGAAEKIQQEAQQQKPSDTAPTRTGSQQSKPNTSAMTPPATPINIKVLPNENPISIDSAKIFRDIWCKSTNSTTSGSIDFKGIKTGDLCNAPDDLITAIEDRLKKSRQPFEWMSQSKILKEGGTLIVKNVKAGEKAFFAIAIIIDPFLEKAYIGSYSGLICAADSTNSLNEDNPFRKALESKYGKPASAFTEYDQLKQQIDALEKDNIAARNKAITIKEAKNARDVDDQLPMLKRLLAASNKKSILSINWDFEKGNSKKYATAQILQARWNEIREIGGCKVTYVDTASSGQPSLDYGFVLGVAGSKEIEQIEEEIISKNRAKEKEKVQSAPAPKF
jgi:hypothetical protein